MIGMAEEKRSRCNIIGTGGLSDPLRKGGGAYIY